MKRFKFFVLLILIILNTSLALCQDRLEKDPDEFILSFKSISDSPHPYGAYNEVLVSYSKGKGKISETSYRFVHQVGDRESHHEIVERQEHSIKKEAVNNLIAILNHIEYLQSEESIDNFGMYDGSYWEFRLNYSKNNKRIEKFVRLYNSLITSKLDDPSRKFFLPILYLNNQMIYGNGEHLPRWRY